MIEGADAPALGVVATLAVGSQGGSVLVRMAVRAARETEAFPLTVDMTPAAIHSHVRASKGKLSLVVIEGNICEFDFKGMTSKAVFSELSAVLVSVAGDATTVIHQKSRGLFSRGRVTGSVTLLTGSHLEVKTDQWISGLTMVERANVQGRELHIDSLVLGMAGPAIPVLVPMKSFPRSDSDRHLFMTLEAFSVFHTLARRVTG